MKAYFLIERYQSHYILLTAHQICQTSRQEASILVLGNLSTVAVVHRTGDIKQDIGTEVGFLLVLLDVESISPSPGDPIEVP